MQLLKYAIFLFILGNIFLVIYRQSDDKGLGRWSRSFKAAVLVVAIAAGLIPNSTEEIEPYVPNNPPSIERLLSNQEFNKNDRQVILAKSEGDNPVNPPTRGSGPSNFPSSSTTGARGNPYTPHVNTYRTAPKTVNRGLGGNPAGGGGGIPEGDDTSPALQKWDLEHPSFYSKKKQSEDQCQISDISQYISEFDCTIANRQIQKKYKHAPDFGVSGNYNLENAQLFKDKVIEHMKKTSTQIIEETFKNIEVTHYFDPETGLNVFFNRDNKKFISGWLLKDDQLDNMVNRGSL
jgi:hypothetical protein